MAAHTTEPLHALANDAPALSPIFAGEDVTYPFSNDDSWGSFEKAFARTRNLEFDDTPNKVALLIGESALAETITRIPEQTILLVDNRMGMVQHMGQYLTALREEEHAAAWRQRICDPATLSAKHLGGYRRMLDAQTRHAEGQARTHALSDAGHDRYVAAQKAAQEKAIIPWKADITSYEDMAALGRALRNHDATITLMNLSNVIPYAWTAGDGFSDSAQYANVLSTLPTTDWMPIITTSMRDKSPDQRNLATGPFTGLSNLAQLGGDSMEGRVNKVSGNTYGTSSAHGLGLQTLLGFGVVIIRDYPEDPIQ
jgi:hypothetical protein